MMRAYHSRATMPVFIAIASVMVLYRLAWTEPGRVVDVAKYSTLEYRR